MGKLLSQIEKIGSLNLQQIAVDSLNDIHQDIELGQQSQLYRGENSAGEPLKRYRSRQYAERKNQLNPLPGFGNPDLRLTGDFYRSIKATAQGTSLIIKATDSKTVFLEKKYGKDLIFGINKETKPGIVIKLRPVFFENIRKIIKL